MHKLNLATKTLQTHLVVRPRDAIVGLAVEDEDTHAEGDEVWVYLQL